VQVDGGWRIYSSGAGIFMRLALQFARAGREDGAPQA
jgi:hypothetical protein